MLIQKDTKMALKEKQSNAGFTIIELMIAISILSMLLLLCTFGIMRISQSYYRGIIRAKTQTTTRAIFDNLTQNVQFNGVGSILTKTENTSDGSANYEVRTICIGAQRYSFALNYQQNDQSPAANAGTLKHAFWRDVITDISNCRGLQLHQDDPSSHPIDAVLGQTGTGGKELLGGRMRLLGFKVEKCSNPPPASGVVACSANASENLYRIVLSTMYGDKDLIDFTGYSTTDSTTWSKPTCKLSQGVFGGAFCAKSDLTSIVGKRLR